MKIHKMADQDFKFSELKDLKLVQYRKQHLKPAVFKKCKAAIILVDYKLAGKKTPCVIVPFKKGPIAAKMFKEAKKNKEHLMKKTGLASLAFGVDARGQISVTIDLKKGGLSPAVLEEKAAKIFGEIKMSYQIIGNADATPEETEENTDTDSAEGDDNSNDAAPTAQEILNELKLLIQSVAASMKNQVKPVVSNVKAKSVTEEDRDIIDDVLDSLVDLTKAFGNAEERIQNAVKAHYDKVIAYKPSLDKIQKAIEKILPEMVDSEEEAVDTVVDLTEAIGEAVNSALESVGEAFGKAFESLDSDIVEIETDLPEDTSIQALRDLMNKGGDFMKNCLNDLDGYETSIQQNADEAKLPEGAEMLNDLF